MMQGIIGVSSRGVDGLTLQVESMTTARSRFGPRSILALLAGAGFLVYLCYLALRPEPAPFESSGDIASVGAAAQR